jgi:hypothetical protein
MLINGLRRIFSFPDNFLTVNAIFGLHCRLKSGHNEEALGAILPVAAGFTNQRWRRNGGYGESEWACRMCGVEALKKISPTEKEPSQCGRLFFCCVPDVPRKAHQ